MNSLQFRGIILAPLLIFIALVSMIAGTVAVLNRGVFAWDSGESRGQLNAATLKKQAADLKAGFNQAFASGIEGGLITLFL